ncbi:MAG: T9SS type A sorting domain-containing protein [Salinivirgaceae bacterium]|nr:T9SS type A sorting domain-containing protein [Salinivirgaceae bacterium]MDD4748060.1 T9SS type A sorting domain-containing protein [Salinivirgaceae bacterium]MDY0279566.1 T9SS type A sorting domain-containing protein [Salinivirgaceae bacterium]
MKQSVLSIAMLLGLWFNGHSQYIAEILEYAPAPGQLINTPSWGTLEAANSIIGGLSGHVTLGAWGGYVVFRFDNPVENHPNNPYGVDFTIFGNPLPDWSEPGIVWVMKDENGNNLPDDTWYELAGSDYYFSNTVKNYEVTYTNPNQEVACDVPWTDNLGQNGFVYANRAHTQPYYPLASNFPQISTSFYTLRGTQINPEVDSTSPMTKIYKRAFGYADNVARRSEPWSKPDNPYTHETENSGGDAFDISWAVDADGNHIFLDQIHFVKVQNGMLADGGRLGEVSTEICGAIKVAPNPTVTGQQQMIAIKDLPPTLTTQELQLEALAFNLGIPQTNETILWSTPTEGASIDNNGLLHVSSSGVLTVTATLASNPKIIATTSTTINLVGITELTNYRLEIYPNPASEYISLSETSGELSIFNIEGQRVKLIHLNGNLIPISDLPMGLYIVKLRLEHTICTAKLFIKD